MSRKRLIIWIVAAALLAIGTTACSIGGDDETTTVTVSETTASGSGTSSGKTVKIIASVPPTDHGWLGAISKDAQAAADAHDDIDFELLQAADADSQAQQIEQAIAQKPDVLVVLPQDGAALGRPGNDRPATEVEQPHVLQQSPRAQDVRTGADNAC